MSRPVPYTPREPDRLLREPEVARIATLSRMYRWRLEAAGQFPRRIQIGPQSVAWRESEIMGWLDNLPRGAPPLQKESPPNLRRSKNAA